MAAKYSKSVQKELMQREIEQNPEITTIRLQILILMLTWIVSRILVTAVEIVGAVQGMWDFQATNLSGLAVMAIFAAGVYAGERGLAILPIIGGGVMLVQWFVYDYLTLMISDEFYMIARIYATLFLLTSLIQIGVFVYLTVSKSIAPLFDAHKRSIAAARQDWELTHME